MSNSFFERVPIEVPNRSAKDMSHETVYTGRCGQLRPIMVDYLLPGDKVSVGHNLQVQLPPMAGDFYGRVDYKVEAFFVPYRLLFGGWQRIISNVPIGRTSDSAAVNVPSSQAAGNQLYDSLPTMTIPANYYVRDFWECFDVSGSTSGEITVNIMAPLAYHRIYDDWYRDSRLQQPVFQPGGTLPRGYFNGTDTPSLASLPYIQAMPPADLASLDISSLFNDGTPIYTIRQRNWAKDYFTNATLDPQLRAASSVSVGSDGTFSIASLRAANALQQFAERNNLAGLDYANVIRAQFGVDPAGASMNKPLFLGRQTVPVYNKSIFTTSETSTDSSVNPYGGVVGSKYSSPQAIDASSLIGEFEAKEHGILMVIGSLVPRRLYSNVVRRQMLDVMTSKDIAWPMLAGIGDQEIRAVEVTGDFALVEAGSDPTFGYTQRYSEYKFMADTVKGELRDGGTLEAFALQSSPSAATINSSFVTIPTTYMSQVKAYSGTSDSVKNIDFWADSYFSYTKVSTLPDYSLPTLGEMKNTHTETIVPQGGRL